jgi:hypothetical protein
MRGMEQSSGNHLIYYNHSDENNNPCPYPACPFTNIIYALDEALNFPPPYSVEIALILYPLLIYLDTEKTPRKKDLPRVFWSNGAI